ncbi:hypothetical protein CKO32_09135 [Afifella marina DSM 2698]|uniref:Ribbon-helix-helix protein, copG family n=1 Tax=Afifella marina DSM 2698 TaxID=1120955 RepID=A0A1G5NKC5_AFIMA|nr:hypothetical protein [Afifella marina DSM 2698]MBK1626718.1 hypothetical protein [Afifella marina]MBK5916267.1 hypothetical protein [Afifella marina]RAI21544.1 hypothetical protein CH311_05840 [Afifella marina DSM 2698]SCZ37893.1 hypothetical protein SAMN03080610_02275 [Afifella marina DSM 2698]
MSPKKSCWATSEKLASEASGAVHKVVVTLTDEQLAAAEGWRSARGIPERSEALGELIRLGLLSEISRVYRLA